MAIPIEEQRSNGPGKFALSLLLIVPSILSFLASAAIVQNLDFPASALWFIYEVSWYIGIVGALIIVAMLVNGALQGTISAAFLWLMATVAVIGIALIWYASHIYRSPWYS